MRGWTRGVAGAGPRPGSAEAGAEEPSGQNHGRAGGGQSGSAPGRRAGSAEGGMAGGGCPGRLAPVLLLALLWPGRAAAEVSERRDGAAAPGPAGAAAGPGAQRARPRAPRCHRAGWPLVGKER